MRPIFTKPIGSQELSRDQLARLRQLPFAGASYKNLERLSVFIDTFEAYRKLDLGLNPQARKDFKAKLNADHDLHSLHQLISEMRVTSSRYHWNVTFTQLLDTESFWRTASKLVAGEQSTWVDKSPYAYYSSDDLCYLSNHVLTQIQAYCDVAAEEYKTKRRDKKYADFSVELSAFNDYVVALKNKVSTERQRIAQAMLVRLELADSYQDMAFDDVLYDMSTRLARAGLNEPRGIEKRPYDRPRLGLNPEAFHYFHHYVMAYGTPNIRARCRQLTWVREGYYDYDETKRRWFTSKTLVAGADVPSRLRWPSWLFRGRNTRYKAFHDVARVLNVRASFKRSIAFQTEISQKSNDDFMSLDYQALHHDFLFIKKEYQRINALRKKLTPIIHGQARDALKLYRQELIDSAETNILTQLIFINKAIQSLSTVIDQNKVLDQLLNLSEQLQEAVQLFSKDHTIIIDQKTEQSMPLHALVQQYGQGLKNKIATQKINRFILDLQNKTFGQQLVYDPSGKLMYRLSQAAEVSQYFETFQCYLSLEQQSSLALIKSVIQGYYTHEGQPVSYSEIYRAAQVLTSNPDDIIQPLFRRYVASSIVSTGTAGYQLLLEYEQTHPSERNKRSTILEAVQEAENISLTSALSQALSQAPNLQEVRQITVDTLDLPVDQFCQRVSLLPSRVIETKITPYLDNFEGDNENLWSIFAALPEQFAIPYAHKRLAYLLRNNRYDEIEQSACCRLFASVLKKNKSAQKTLMSELTVTLTDQNLVLVDALMQRFADEKRYEAWCYRYEQYLVERLVSVLVREGDFSQDLYLYLSQHPNWLTSPSAKQQLHLVLSNFRMKGWTEVQHILLSTLEDPELRKTYYLRLFKHILSNREFATTHSDHLPNKEEIFERYSLMSMPQFREIVSAALARFKQQDYIDNVDAIRVLESWLHDDLAETLDLTDLTKELDSVLLKFKDQIHVERLSGETIGLMDAGVRDKALAKIQRLRAVYDYYQSMGNAEEQQKVAQTLQNILLAVQERFQLPVTDQRVLMSHEALALVTPIDCLQEAEPLLWQLKNYEKLLNITANVQAELTQLISGATTAFPSLQLFLEALQRNYLVLEEEGKSKLVLLLKTLIDSASYQALSPEIREHIAGLHQFLGGELGAQDLIASEEQAPLSAPEPPVHFYDPATQTPQQSLPTHSIEFQAKGPVSSAIIEDLQKGDKTYQGTFSAMQEICRKDIAIRNVVFDELMEYLIAAYTIFIDEDQQTESFRVYAGDQLACLRMLVNQLGLEQTHPFIVLVNQYEKIQEQAYFLTLSLKNINEKGQQHLPELGQLILLSVQSNLIDADLKQQWIDYLSKTLLPRIQQKQIQVNPQLDAVLPLFLKCLNGTASIEEQEKISAYENYYCDVVQASMQQTSQVRIMPPPSQPTSLETLSGIQVHSRVSNSI